MSTTTSKLKLVKPDPNDFVDISVINDNMDILDEAAGDTEMTDETTGKKYKMGVNNGLVYIEEVE